MAYTNTVKYYVVAECLSYCIYTLSYHIFSIVSVPDEGFQSFTALCNCSQWLCGKYGSDIDWHQLLLRKSPPISCFGPPRTAKKRCRWILFEQHLEQQELYAIYIHINFFSKFFEMSLTVHQQQWQPQTGRGGDNLNAKLKNHDKTS